MTNPIDKNLARQIVYTVSEVCDRNVNFISPSGLILASTDETRVGTFHEIGKKVADTHVSIEVNTNAGYAGTLKGINMPVYFNHSLVAVIGISGEPDEIRKFAHLAENITNLLIRERELGRSSRIQSEKHHFILSSLTGDEPYDRKHLISCLEEAGFRTGSPKRLILIRTETQFNAANLYMLEPRVESLFRSVSPSIYTCNYPSEFIGMIEADALDSFRSPLRNFVSEYKEILKAGVGLSTPVLALKESYDSAVTAIRTLSEMSRDAAIFDELDLELIISDLNPENAKQFIQKVLQPLNEEEIDFLRIFFEESFSLASTSRRTYLHKNTVQYRLNRIASKTGLNPRVFQDAVRLYMALVVNSSGITEENR